MCRQISFPVHCLRWSRSISGSCWRGAGDWKCVWGFGRATKSWPEGAWVVASDSVLLGELLNGVSTLGGTAKHQDKLQSPEASRPDSPQPEHLKQSLVWSPGQVSPREVIARAREVYEQFCGPGSDKALICLGSMKSNPVAELILANAFGCEPFESKM